MCGCFSYPLGASRAGTFLSPAAAKAYVFSYFKWFTIAHSQHEQEELPRMF